MPKKYLIALVAVLVLALAVWLVPMALGASNAPTPGPSSSSNAAPSQGSGTTHQCPAGGSNSGGSNSELEFLPVALTPAHQRT